jgi:hypothetical protein
LFAALWLVKAQNTPFDQPFVAEMVVTIPGTTPRRRRGTARRPVTGFVSPSYAP